MNEDKSLLTIYEPNMDKKTLKDQINEALVLYNSAAGKDKDEMARKLIVYSKTLEQALMVGYTGMTDLYDEKCDIEEENKELRIQNEKLKSIIEKECKSNPKLMEEFNRVLNTPQVPSKKGKRDYNDMIDKYILKAKRLTH